MGPGTFQAALRLLEEAQIRHDTNLTLLLSAGDERRTARVAERHAARVVVRHEVLSSS